MGASFRRLQQRRGWVPAPCRAATTLQGPGPPNSSVLTHTTSSSARELSWKPVRGWRVPWGHWSSEGRTGGTTPGGGDAYLQEQVQHLRAPPGEQQQRVQGLSAPAWPQQPLCAGGNRCLGTPKAQPVPHQCTQLAARLLQEQRPPCRQTDRQTDTSPRGESCRRCSTSATSLQERHCVIRQGDAVQPNSGAGNKILLLLPKISRPAAPGRQETSAHAPAHPGVLPWIYQPQKWEPDPGKQRKRLEGAAHGLKTSPFPTHTASQRARGAVRQFGTDFEGEGSRGGPCWCFTPPRV